MRAATSITLAGGTLVVLALGGGLVSLAYADPGSGRPKTYVPQVEPVAVVVTDADRRLELNRRLQLMLKDGRGRRLADPRPVRHAGASPSIPAPGASRMVRRSPAPATTVSPRTNEPASRIAPPVTTAMGLARMARPRLDLTTPANVPSDAIECLTQTIYYEARSESEEGQAAVAAVVMNRSRSGRYPTDVCKVVYQRNSRTCQFTFTCDGSIGRRSVNMTQWARAERIAREVYEGRSQIALPHSSVNYHADYVKPSWGRRLERVRQIGAHIFYGAALPGFSNPGAAGKGRNAPVVATGLQFVDIPGFSQASPETAPTR